jgi:hypothetical protein
LERRSKVLWIVGPIHSYHLTPFTDSYGGIFFLGHYQAFAAALPHQATLLNNMGEVQSQIHNARSLLLEAKDALSNKRADLVQLWSRGQTLEEMIRLLDQMYANFHVSTSVYSPTHFQ